MIVGPIFISFASPFFVCVAIVILTLIYFLYARRKKHNEIPTTKGFLLNKMSTKMRLVKILTFILSSAAILIFISASLDPRLAKYEMNSTQSRRILILFDGSGSMTVVFDDSNSPLPMRVFSYEGRGEFESSNPTVILPEPSNKISILLDCVLFVSYFANLGSSEADMNISIAADDRIKVSIFTNLIFVDILFSRNPFVVGISLCFFRRA